MLFPCFLGQRRVSFLSCRSSRPEVFCKKVFLEISQNSQENTCARVSFLIKLQASGFFWIPFFLIVEVFFLHILYEFHQIKFNVMKYTLNCVLWNSLKEIFHSVSSHLVKKDTLAQVFSCEFCKISMEIFFYRTPPVRVFVITFRVKVCRLLPKEMMN